jgi:hypothetical protein
LGVRSRSPQVAATFAGGALSGGGGAGTAALSLGAALLLPVFSLASIASSLFGTAVRPGTRWKTPAPNSF